MYTVQLITEADGISHFGFTTTIYGKTEQSELRKSKRLFLSYLRLYFDQNISVTREWNFIHN